MANFKGPSPKVKKGIRLISYGLAGDIAGTLVGIHTGINHKITSKVGAGIGIGTGVAGEAYFAKRKAKRAQVPSVQATVGRKEFKKRVGTKTNSRVAKKDNPYAVGGRANGKRGT